MIGLRLPGGASSAGFAGRPSLMLFLGLCGMATGLAIDCGVYPPEVLASLCTAGADSFAQSLGVHLAVLPATHLMMLLGAGLAIAMTATAEGRAWRDGSIRSLITRSLPSAASASAMVVGMDVGGWLGPPLALNLGIGSGFARLTIVMVFGMVAGMVIAMPLYRLSRRAPELRRRQSLSRSW